MLKGFRDFILRGNALDLAIGVIIGAAFGAVVNSVVTDVITPLIGLIGGVRFDDIFILLRDGNPLGPYPTLAAARAAGAITINVGLLLNTIVNLLIVGFILYLIVRSISHVSKVVKKEDDAPPPVDPAVERQERLIASMDRLTSSLDKRT